MKRSDAISQMVQKIIINESEFACDIFASLIIGGGVSLHSISGRELNRIFDQLFDVYMIQQRKNDEIAKNSRSRLGSTRFGGGSYSGVSSHFTAEELPNTDSFQLIFKTICDERITRIVANSPDYTSDKRGGFVYLMGDVQNRYKIGKAYDPVKRQKGITKGSNPLFILHAIATNDYSTLESQLHDQYSDKHARGEWFDLTEDDIAKIRTVKSRRFGDDDIVRKYSCEQIKQVLMSGLTELDPSKYQEGWQAGYSDGTGDMVIGYSCATLDPSYCAGYISAYGIASGENLSGDVFNWESYPDCDSSDNS